jgi:sialate O-acetylesterase
MVLQRNAPIIIWGWANPGERVTVSLAGKEKKARANGKGDWGVRFAKRKADGKPLSITITGQNTIELEDILIGDVWLGSGQSNMEWHLKSTHDAGSAIAAATDSKIRLFSVPKVQARTPAKDVNAKWQVCSPHTAGTFSGVLYHFGRRLRKDVDVPFGLINSSWSGSAIEPWTVAGRHSGAMYNGMIAPLRPLVIRGVIWYQGETNVLQKNGMAYFDKQKALIDGWRRAWKRYLPFYYVQIAPYSGYGPGQLPALWEAQVACLKLKKRDVGERLALWALAKTYGKKDLVYSGPLFKGVKAERGGKLRVFFAHVGGGLKSRGGAPLNEFQVAGKDSKFVKATAVIDGDTVVVEAEGVAKPQQVRFGWHKVANPNLMNAEGLPASPFQSRGWKGGTGVK